MNDINVSIDADKIKSNWKWFLTLGVTLIVLGFIGVSCSFLATKLFISILGILLMIAGISQISHVIVSPRWQAAIFKLLLGLFYVAAGISFIKHPTAAATWFTLFIGCFLLSSGILKLLIGLNHRYAKEWTMGIFSGFLSTLLGVMLLLNWPISGVWFIGFVISLELIFTGWTYVAFATGAKNINTDSSINIKIHQD